MPNPQKAGHDWPPAVVASVFQTGLNLIRDLTRHGVRAVGVDSNPNEDGFLSVYGESHVCPDPDSAPGAWLDFMRSLSRKLGNRPALIPASDQFVEALGRHAAALAEYYRFPPAGPAVQAMLGTKEQQYALARRHGFPCPRTEYIQSVGELES